MKKRYSNIRVTIEVYEFLNDCKHKAKCKSFEELFRKVGGYLWSICEQLEKESRQIAVIERAIGINMHKIPTVIKEESKE